jgi:hypothetical protein
MSEREKLFVSATEYGQIRHADTSEVSEGGFLILSGGKSYAGIRPHGFGYALPLSSRPSLSVIKS